MLDKEDLTTVDVAVLGTGLMGGSLALALRGKCRRLFAYDPNLDTVTLAQQMRLADQVSSDPGEVLAQADLIVLAAPVGAILETLHELPALHDGEAVVLDLGSTKSAIVQAMDELPPRFDPIGGHPMCGKETSGLAQAEAGLFQGAPFALTPLQRTSLRARSLAEQLARAAGARPLWLSPAEHDSWAAATSHLPYLAALALALSTPSRASALIGPGFRSTTRIAATSPRIMLDILQTNSENVLEALEQFRGCLDLMETHLRSGDARALGDLLARGSAAQINLAAPAKGSAG